MEQGPEVFILVSQMHCSLTTLLFLLVRADKVAPYVSEFLELDIGFGFSKKDDLREY